MCGEKFSKSTRKRSGIGSPPRVRGKVLSIPAAGGFAGITPACAGKRKYSIRLYELIWDHPRVCGEKSMCSKSLQLPQGSPPRVRGKVVQLLGAVNAVGITPACAGKRLKKAHKIKDFDPVPIRFHLVFRRFERWCSNLPMPDGNVPV